jgi:hypothetical protein
LRIVFALFFVSMGLWALASAFGIGQPPQQPTQAAARFTEALTKTGFIDPLLGASFIVGGLAMLRTRTTPLGLVVLAPAVAVILFFHLWLSGQYVWGPFVAAYFLLLCWRYRSGLAPLWNYRDARAREAEQSCPLGPLSAAFEQSRYIRAR